MRKVLQCCLTALGAVVLSGCAIQGSPKNQEVPNVAQMTQSEMAKLLNSDGKVRYYDCLVGLPNMEETCFEYSYQTTIDNPPYPYKTTLFDYLSQRGQGDLVPALRIERDRNFIKRAQKEAATLKVRRENHQTANAVTSAQSTKSVSTSNSPQPRTVISYQVDEAVIDHDNSQVIQSERVQIEFLLPGEQ